MRNDGHSESPENPDGDPLEGGDHDPEPNPNADPVDFEIPENRNREPLSDDPEVNAIGKLGLGEIEQIAKNPEDSRHEVGKEYLRLQGEALSAATEPLLRSINQQYSRLWKNIIGQAMPKFDVSQVLPKVDMSQFAPKLDYPSKAFEGSLLGSSRSPDGEEAPTASDVPAEPPPPLPKNSAEEAIREARATTAAILETNERISDLIGQYKAGVASTSALMTATNERLAEMLNQAKSEAAEQRVATIESNEHAAKSRHQTWWAIGVTVLVGLAQIVIGIVALIC